MAKVNIALRGTGPVILRGSYTHGTGKYSMIKANTALYRYKQYGIGKYSMECGTGKNSMVHVKYFRVLIQGSKVFQMPLIFLKCK